MLNIVELGYKAIDEQLEIQDELRRIDIIERKYAKIEKWFKFTCLGKILMVLFGCIIKHILSKAEAKKHAAILPHRNKISQLETKIKDNGTYSDAERKEGVKYQLEEVVCRFTIPRQCRHIDRQAKQRKVRSSEMSDIRAQVRKFVQKKPSVVGEHTYEAANRADLNQLYIAYHKSQNERPDGFEWGDLNISKHLDIEERRALADSSDKQKDRLKQQAQFIHELKNSRSQKNQLGLPHYIKVSGEMPDFVRVFPLKKS